MAGRIEAKIPSRSHVLTRRGKKRTKNKEEDGKILLSITRAKEKPKAKAPST